VTDTIHYVATDTDGLTATSTRTVLIKAAVTSGSSSVSRLRPSQIGYRRSTGFALVEPRSFVLESSLISHKKPIGLPRSTTPDKNMWVFVA
jgi:hypothetical protein